MELGEFIREEKIDSFFLRDNHVLMEYQTWKVPWDYLVKTPLYDKSQRSEVIYPIFLHLIILLILF